MSTIPSKEDLIEGLKSFAEEVDGVPTIREMRNVGPYSPHYYKKKFGSWHDALRIADIQPTHGVKQDVDQEELIAELKKVDEMTDRPPRRVDVEEHGEYSYILYQEEFESFILALEEAGIDPDEKQYRFSSVDVPERKQGSANIKKLRNDGPTPSTELPQGRSMKDRQRGMWKFNINSGATQPADVIYYLNGEHAPELVIRRFFEENPHVLEYRDPHGIKIDIKNHQTSWKGIGQNIVDELVESGVVNGPSFENLVVMRIYKVEPLRYCFDRSVSTGVDTDELAFDREDIPSFCPVWGFVRENEDIWRSLSENDGLLFSTQPGVYTHYVPIATTVENTDIMTELWVEYEDGVRSGGIENPRPYLVLGKDVREIRISEQDIAEELVSDPNEEPIQLFNEEALEAFLNRYGSFESYLRDRDRSLDPTPSGVEIHDRSSIQDVVDALLQVSMDDLPVYKGDSDFETIEREKREAAFREGIYEIYQDCAICGLRIESPNGTHNLEAAHILPKAQNGPDVLQNGLGLCSRHHWAFDNGWFEITADYEIQVRDYPELDGYDEMKRYDGASLQVPNREQLRPHPTYIQLREW